MTVLHVNKLRFSWPGASRETLRIDNLALEAGQSLFLHGRSGCGKSTLLSAISGVVKVSALTINVAGQDIGVLRGGSIDRFRADHIGIIFQIFNLIPWLNAVENVLLPVTFSATRRKKAGPDPRDTALRLLKELGLEDDELLQSKASGLSVGQQQRVAAARALIGAPDLVLADEPTSALDEETREIFVDLLIKECSAANAALLFVSHDRGLEKRFDKAVDFNTLNRGKPD